MSSGELQEYRDQFEQVKAEARELTAGLTEADFNWRPSPEQWSIEECLEHLRLVGQWQVRALEGAIRQAREQGRTAAGPFEYGPLNRFILRLSEPPVRLRFPAPRRFQPLHGQPLTAVLPTFYHVQEQFQLHAHQAEGLDLKRVKVPTPMSSLFKLSLGTMFAQAAAHERRHMQQARRVRQRLAERQ
jgi:hypothetical protein